MTDREVAQTANRLLRRVMQDADFAGMTYVSQITVLGSLIFMLGVEQAKGIKENLYE